MILTIIILLSHYYYYYKKEIKILLFVKTKCFEKQPYKVNIGRGSLQLPGGQAVFNHLILIMSMHLLSIVYFL